MGVTRNHTDEKQKCVYNTFHQSLHLNMMFSVKTFRILLLRLNLEPMLTNKRKNSYVRKGRNEDANKDGDSYTQKISCFVPKTDE